MKPARSPIAARGALALLALLGLCPAAALSASVPSVTAWEVTRGEVRIVCPLTVGGSFEAKSPSLAGEVTLRQARPPAFEGALTVDLRTLSTGIDLRDRHMRDEYLEVGRGDGFERAVLTDVTLGDVDPETAEGRTSFTATLLLHGTRKTVEGKTELHRQGSSVRLEATFPVTLADYGIPKPQYLGVGVRTAVEVHVQLLAVPAASEGAR